MAFPIIFVDTLTVIERLFNVYAISRQNIVNNSSRFRVVPGSSDIIRTNEHTSIQSKPSAVHKTLPPKGPFALLKMVRKGVFWGHGKTALSRVHAHMGEEDACR